MVSFSDAALFFASITLYMETGLLNIRNHKRQQSTHATLPSRKRNFVADQELRRWKMPPSTKIKTPDSSLMLPLYAKDASHAA